MDEIEDAFSTNSGTKDAGYGSLLDQDFSSTSNDEHDPLVAGLVKTYEQSWAYQTDAAEAEAENERRASEEYSIKLPFRSVMLVLGFFMVILAVVSTIGGKSSSGQEIYSDSNLPPISSISPPLPAIPPNPPDKKQTDDTPPPLPASADAVTIPSIEVTPPTIPIAVVIPEDPPTRQPTADPKPSEYPTKQPSGPPTTKAPTLEPTPSSEPSAEPVIQPTPVPSPIMAGKHKTREPSVGPSRAPVTSKPSLSPTHQPTRTPPPNVIFVLADDLGYHSLSTDLTPFLMSMRANGVILGKYYSQEVCTPTRASFLTGRYPISLGWQKNEASAFETGGLGLEETTVAEVLKTNGYSTYMFGKWNMGNSSPRYLPTARGFDYFMGYLDGFTNYWSKTDPTAPTYKDFLYSDTQCYYEYDWTDLTTYSTFLYRDKALDAIETHDFRASSMFMYLAFQAVHDPFADSDVTFGSGIPKDYLDDDRYNYIIKNVEGQINQEYYKSLALMDTAIESIYFGLDSRGVLDNTYIIFASDNGGCPASGGKNTPLRGSKGTLFEGGVKVDAFIHSRALESKMIGTVYSNLFHVSDWFPTILDMTKSAEFTPAVGYELDGVSHWDNLRGMVHTAPRQYVLYNYYYNPGKGAADSNDFFKGAPGGIRDARYKLLHTYDSTSAGTWFKASQSNPYGDDNLNEKGGCTQAAAAEGTFTYFLFDMDSDPNETNNLYDSSVAITEIQQTLYKQITFMTSADKVKTVKTSKRATGTCELTWQANDGYITPWEAAEDDSTLPAHRTGISYPNNCGVYSSAIATGRAAPFTTIAPVAVDISWSDMPATTITNDAASTVTDASTTSEIAPPTVVTGPTGVASGPGTGIIVSGPGMPPPADTVVDVTSSTTPSATTATTATTTTTTTTTVKGPAPWDQRHR